MSTGKESSVGTWAALIVVCIAMFIVTVDSTVMNVAVSDITRDLDTTVGAVQGVISLYSLVMAALMITGGKVGDIYGKRRMFAVGVALFGSGAVIAALSPSVGVLALGWSVIEGIAGALIMPLALALISGNYEGELRSFAFGVVGGTVAVGAAVGPVLGGLITTFASWRWAFGSLAAVAAVDLLLVRYVRPAERVKGEAVDWAGAALVALGMGAIVLGIGMSSTYGWWIAKRPFVLGGFEIAPLGLSVVPFLLAFGGLALLAFVRWQRRRERQGKTPLVDLALLSNAPFLAGISTEAVQTLAIAGLQFVVPVFLQGLLGYSALATGLTLLPLSISLLIVSLTAARLSRFIRPKRLVQLGLGTILVGAALTYAVSGTGVSGLHLAPGFLIIGAGVGVMVSQLPNLILASVPDSEVGEASGVKETTRELGQSLGTTMIGAAMLAAVYGSIAGGVLGLVDDGSLVPQERAAITQAVERAVRTFGDPKVQQEVAALPQATQDTLRGIVNQALVDGHRYAMLCLMFCVLAALGISVFLSNKQASELGEPPVGH